jgi:hypothetical protein
MKWKIDILVDNTTMYKCKYGILFELEKIFTSLQFIFSNLGLILKG